MDRESVYRFDDEEVLQTILKVMGEKLGREVRKDNLTLSYKSDGYYDRVLGGARVVLKEQS